MVDPALIGYQPSLPVPAALGSMPPLDPMAGMPPPQPMASMPPPMDQPGAGQQNPFDQFDTPQSRPAPRSAPPSFISGPPAGSTKTPDEIRKEKADADIAEQKARDAAAEGKLATMGPTSDIHGEEYLKKFVPPAQWELVRAYARGDLGARAGGLSASMLPVIQHAMNFDPSSSGVNFPARVAMRTQLSKGDPNSIGGGLRSMEQMLMHGADVLDKAQALNRFPSGVTAPLNYPIAGAEALVQDPNRAAFNQAVQNYAPESQKAIAGTAGGEREREARAAAYPSTMSHDAIAAGLQSDATMAFQRMGAINDQYRRVMGKDITDALSPEAKAAYDKIMAGGYDKDGNPLHPAPGWKPISGGSAGTPPASGSPPPADGSPPPIKVGNLGGGRMDASSKIDLLGEGPGQKQLSGEVKTVTDPWAHQYGTALGHLVASGAPQEQVEAFIRQTGGDPSKLGHLGEAIAWRQTPGGIEWVKRHPGVPVEVIPTYTVPLKTTSDNPLDPGSEAGNAQIAKSPFGTFVTNAASVPLDIAQATARATGNSEWADNLQSKREMQAANHPIAAIAGNMVGTIAPTMAAESALANVGGKIAGPVGDIISSPITADTLSGAGQGALANPNDPLGGAAMGGAFNAVGGMVGRGVTGAVAPTAGKMAPLYDAGVKSITPGQRIGGLANIAEQGLEQIPIVGGLVRGARNQARNEAQLGAFNNALKPIDGIGGAQGKLPDGMMPGTDPHAFAQAQFARAYPEARAGMQFAPDEEYNAARQSLNDEIKSGGLSDESEARFNKTVDAFDKRVSTGSGADYAEAQTALNKRIAALRNSPSSDQELAGALEQFSHIADDAARRASTPEAVAKLDAVDKGYAQLVRIERAAASPANVDNPGQFTGKQYATAVMKESGGRAARSKEFLRGDALGQDYAGAMSRLGEPTSEVATLPKQGTATAALGAAGYLSPTAAAVPVALTLPYAPGARKILSAIVAPRNGPVATALGAIAGRGAQAAIATAQKRKNQQ